MKFMGNRHTFMGVQQAADQAVSAVRVADKHAVGFEAIEQRALALRFALGVGKMRPDFLVRLAEDRMVAPCKILVI